MPRLPILPEPPDKVFGLATPQHMLMKLGWEIAGLRSALSVPIKPGAEPAYHAFNCAVTAWHMTDWIWQSATADDRVEVLSKLAAPATGKSNFGAFTQALTQRHRVLHICRQIATGSKHKIVERHPDADVGAKQTVARRTPPTFQVWHSFSQLFDQPFDSRRRGTASRPRGFRGSRTNMGPVAPGMGLSGSQVLWNLLAPERSSSPGCRAARSRLEHGGIGAISRDLIGDSGCRQALHYTITRTFAASAWPRVWRGLALASFAPHNPNMPPDLTEDDKAIIDLLCETIERDRFPRSPRVKRLRGILAKFGDSSTPAIPYPAPAPGSAVLAKERRW